MDDNSIISNYMKRVGVRRYPSLQSCRKYLERRHGAEIVSELLDVVSRRGEGEDVDVNPILYTIQTRCSDNPQQTAAKL